MRRRALLLTGLCLLLPALAVAGSWRPTITVGTLGNAFDPPPLIAVADSGEGVVAWSTGAKVRAAARTPDGSWSSAQELGNVSGGTDSMGLAIASQTSEAMLGWWDGSTVRTATRAEDSSWVLASGEGTWALGPDSSAARVRVGMTSGGDAAVAWEQTGAGAGVWVARRTAGAWSAPVAITGLTGLSHGAVLRDGVGGVVVAGDGGGPTLVRLDPSGIQTRRAFGRGRIESIAGSSITNTFALGVYLGGEFAVIEGSLATLAAVERQHVAAARPGLQTFSRAGGAALRPGTAQPSAAWIDGTGGRHIGGATAIADTWQSTTAVTAGVTSADVARLAGDESIVVFTSASNVFGVYAVVRTPCDGTAWSAPIPLDTEANYGAVGIAAGGRTAIGAWIDTQDNVRAAVYTGDAPTGDAVCDQDYTLPSDDVGCASGERAGLTDTQQFPDIAACAGQWSGQVSNAIDLCAPGWAVCAAGDPALQEVTFTDARAFGGCYLYDAAEDFDTCARCDGTAAHDDMAGMGNGCDGYVSPGAGSCLNGGGRNEAVCCGDVSSGTACQYKPGLTSGAVCCRSAGSSGGSTTTTASTTTSTSSTIAPSTTTTTSTSSTTTTLAPCTTTGECDDGDPCNGAEICQAGFCRSATQATCTPSGALAVVPRYGDDRADIVDLGSGVALASVAVGHGPWATAWSPGGRYAYVTDRLGDAVSVIDVVARAAVVTVAVDRTPLGVAVHPVTGMVYVAAHDADAVVVIDPSTNAIVDRIPVGDGPAGVAIDPSGARLYVADYRDDTVAVVDTVTARVVARIPTARQPLTLAVHPDGSKVYVACYSDAAVGVIGTSSLSLLARLQVGRQPTGIAFAANGTRALVACGGDETVAIVDAAADRVVGKHALGGFPFGMASDPTTAAVWVTRSRAGALSQLDGANGVAQREVAIAGTPAGIGQFIGRPPDDCPAKPLSCDDGNPFTQDACSATTACSHAELTGFDGVAAGAAAIDTLAAALTTPDAPAVRRLRAAVGGLDAAVAQALSGEGDRTALRRQLGRIIRTVENAPAGALGTNRSRLLDLARAARRRLIQ